MYNKLRVIWAIPLLLLAKWHRGNVHAVRQSLTLIYKSTEVQNVQQTQGIMGQYQCYC